MAINVKKLKRVTLGGEPLKEFNAGDKKPAFRQNGYQLDFTTATNGNISYNGTDYPQTGLILSFEAEGLTWLFGESRGTSIESETGEFSTISINEDLSFLDSTVWNKKSFALEFDSANSEYLQTENISITKISDVQFKQKLDIDLANTTIGSILSFGVGGNYFFLAVNTANIISIDGVDDLGNSFFTSGSVINGTELIEFDGVKLYIDGVVDIDLSSFGELPFVTNTPFYLGKLAYQTSRYYTGSISSFELQGETFDLTEGLGNQVYGSNGTIATINTSNAQGIERTNYGQWLKGDDTNGWNPYT